MGPSPLGNFPYSHLQSLSLADRTVLVDILYLTEFKRNVSTFSSSLHCCSNPSPHPLISWAQWPPQGSAPKGTLGGSNHLLNLEVCPSNGHQHGLICPLNSQCDFHRATPHTGIPLMVQFLLPIYLTLWLGHWLWPMSS